MNPEPPGAADCPQLRMKAYVNRADPCIFLSFLGGGAGGGWGMGGPSNAPSHGNQREFPLFHAINSTEKQGSSSYHLSSPAVFKQIRHGCYRLRKNVVKSRTTLYFLQQIFASRTCNNVTYCGEDRFDS